jgi:hypothetical protein
MTLADLSSEHHLLRTWLARETGLNRQFPTRRASNSSEAGADPGTTDTSGTREPLSRRKIFKKAVGMAAVGAAGSAVLTEAMAPPAAAATITEQGAIAPAVVNLTDATTIVVDASLGNDFRVTIAASRTMGNPANAADGQKITFQITQGGNGSSTITWGSSYQFSTGLPAPTLSTTAGQTDLLAFIYNAAKNKWLLVAFVNGFSTPTVTLPKGTYRLFPSTNGPSAPVSYTGPFLAGVAFEVTSGGMWFDGYWWWVCPSGQTTSPQTFALWAVTSNGIGSLISSATVTSGALVSGQWNYVPLKNPVPLAIGVCYNACTGVNGSFPITNNQFGSGEPFSGGIVNGPLSAFSDQSGSMPAPSNVPQGLFGVSGTDPTVYMPANGSNSSNFWMDVLVDTNAPAGSSYRLWPNYPVVLGAASGGSGDTTGYTLATEFQLSQSCTLDNIWFFSPSKSGILPTRCAIWNESTQAVVAGTDNTSPSWSGGAASGWVSCSYSGVTLPAGNYKAAIFSPGGSKWFLPTSNYWGTGGPGVNGITAGPITAPGGPAATSQGTYNPGSWAYPQTYANAGNGENFWVDVEVTPT